jgi:hypothetical protein
MNVWQAGMRKGRTDRAEMVWKKLDGNRQEERFRISPVKENIVVFESSVYPEFYLHASDKTGNDQINWAQSLAVDQNDLDAFAPTWSKFRMYKISEGIYAFESVRWPGFFI